MDSDERLLERFLGGDEQAFDDLVRRHEALLRNVAYGFVRDRALAEDVAQDSFLRAYRKARSFRGQGAVRSWLCRIAVHRAQDELRRIRRKREVPWQAAEELVRRDSASTEERKRECSGRRTLCTPTRTWRRSVLFPPMRRCSKPSVMQRSVRIRTALNSPRS